MKTKIKRHSRAVMSVVLSVCILISCLTVGLIATDAARDDSEAVGDATYYLRGKIHGVDHWGDNTLVMTKSGDCYYYVIDMYKNDSFKFHDGSTWHGPSSNTSVTADSDSKTGESGGNGNFTLNGNDGVYVIWYRPSSEKVWVVSTTLYVDGYINGQDKTGTGGFLMTQNASDATLYEATITTTTATQYLAIYGATSDRYYNFGSGTLAADTWSGDYNNTSDKLDYEKIATSGGASGQTIKVSFSTKDRHIHWTVSSQSYYLHYAENDSGMSGATVQQMTDNGDGTYSYTVSDWDKTKMNMLVNTSSTNVTGTGASTSLTVTADTGLSVDKSTPGENSGYYRMQLSLSSTPQNITFTFNSNTGVLNAAGSLTRYAITAGGASTGAEGGYKLKVSDGSTTINNYGGTATATANFVENKTLTVTVTPDVNTQKVTEISGCSSVTDNGNGTYSGTFTVSSAQTITATIGNKSNYTVTFSAGANGSVTATANGAALSSPATVLEGTKVTFTASPNDGYVFSAWSGGFTDSLSTVTKTITANTTVTGNFAKQGYKIVYEGAYGDSGKSMTEMSNGKYISSVTVGNGWYFKIIDTGKSKAAKSTGTPQSLSKDKEYEVDDWVDIPASWNTTNCYKNNESSAMYVVYDPAADTVYLTSESDGLFSSYDVYIKNGTIRGGSGTTGYSSDYGTAELLAAGASGSETTSGVTSASAYDGRAQKVTLTAAQIRTGVKLSIKATVNADYKTKYYVKGFDVNGGLTRGLTEQEFYEDTAGGHSKGDKKLADDYEDVFSKARVPVDTPWSDFTLELSAEMFPDGKIEITPIYFPLANKESDFVRFYAYDFTEDVKKDWGGSLAVYPYIRDTYYPYGEYPGQLMVNEGGVYYADIPKDYTSGGKTTPIQGLTMNNYVWDQLHYDLFYGSDQTNNNWQTYDYNEFAVINDILQNTHGLENEDIIFSFKYKETVDRDKSNLGESTYYVDSDTNDATRAKDYRNGFQTIEVNDPQYHWEDLTDFYGNKVDIFGALVETTGNDTKKGYNPIRIVSNGYDDNAVGYYATAWALYKPVDASGNNAWTGTVDHYELFDVIGGQGKEDRSFQSESFLIARDSQKRVRMKYDEVYHNAHWGDNNYPQSDLIIDGALVPAQITYEYNIKSDMSNIDTGDHQMAYRSDGRWYYSDSRQLIKGNVIVEVANSKKGPFVRDYFQDDNYDYKSGEYYDPTKHTGKTTGVKAYFTNSNAVSKNGDVVKTNASGNTEAWAISDGKVEHDFLLKAEEDSEGNYEFIGWYRLTESGAGVGYTLASENLEFETEAKTNDVYVARFVKVPSGNLVVSHTLTGEIGKNEVDCKAKVEVLTSDGTLNSTGNTIVYTYPETTANIKVTSKYIKYDNEHKDQKLRITLETTSQKDGKFLFDKFWEKVTSENLSELVAQLEAKGVLAQVSITNNKAIILVTIGSLFNTTDPENPVQNVNSLPFFSSVKLPTIHYNLTYGYDSMIGSNQQYGAQTTEVKGYFTEQEFNKYIVWDDSIVTDDVTSKTGWYKFNPDTYVEFLASKCPYEKNIRRNLTWNYNSLIKEQNGPWYYASDGEFKFTITASDPLIPNKRLNFVLPYYSIEKTHSKSEYLFDENGRIQELSSDDAPSVEGKDSGGQTATFSRYLRASTSFATPYTKDGEDNFVTAPEVIYKGTTPRYFQYWSVQTVPNYVESTEEASYRRYEVARCYNLAYNFSAYQDYIVEAKYGDTRSTHTHLDSATITFAENGRNQWNKLQGSAKWDQGDRIFSNFIISFDRADKIQLNTLGAGDPDIKTGVVFEQLDTLPNFNHTYMELDENDWTVQSEMTYFQKYSGEDTLEAAEAADHGKDDAIKHIRGEATTGTHTYMDSTIKNTNIDNKNRIEFTKAFANINTTNFAPTTRKNYVYRAYAYMQEADGSVTISTPVYFQFYDIATIANATRQTTPAITG